MHTHTHIRAVCTYMYTHTHTSTCTYIYIYICDRILENGSKSHMKSSVFQHIFNYASTYAYVFPKYLLHYSKNLGIKFHVML